MRASSKRRMKRRNRLTGGEDVNPMNYVSNLSDVMLILAVGIMLAILQWNLQSDPVNETAQETAQQSEEQGSQEAVEFSDDDLDNIDEVPENVEKMGEVYYDADTGKYYIVEGK